MTTPTCPYCSAPSKKVHGDHVYPHRPDLRSKVFYVCDPCDARVGAHANGLPLGRLADARLRRLKMAAHAAFDPIWRSRRKSRRDAYAWLSACMDLPSDQTHIGMFDEAQCLRVIECCEQLGGGNAHDRTNTTHRGLDMPTGYTTDITKGQTFEAFVLTCARAFGALIDMRDAPLSAAVPDRIEPSSYYAEALERARKALDDFEAHPSKHHAQWAESNQARVDSYHRRLTEAQAQREAYARMRARVQAWSPPSPDHAGLKSFMLEQIVTSMESDCWVGSPPELPDFAMWVDQHHTSLVANVRRAEKAYAEERQRADDRTRWIKQLKESLR